MGGHRRHAAARRFPGRGAPSSLLAPNNDESMRRGRTKLAASKHFRRRERTNEAGVGVVDAEACIE
jgi:hypothetical protein